MRNTFSYEWFRTKTRTNTEGKPTREWPIKTLTFQVHCKCLTMLLFVKSTENCSRKELLIA